MNDDSKLCLKCALKKLAGKMPDPCGTCILLNIDPLAKVRATALLPSPLMKFAFSSHAGTTLDGAAVSDKPAKAAWGGPI